MFRLRGDVSDTLAFTSPAATAKAPGGYRPMTLTPCDLHEVTNCSICTGADKAYEETLREPTPEGPPPHISGGVTIWAQFPGHCAQCGHSYQPNAAIHRPYGGLDGGWIGVDCCLSA